MDLFHTIIGNYYGLDWAVLLFGLTSSLFMTNGKLQHGMKISVIACSCGFIVALLSAQHGFVAYNALLIAINIRGILRGDRRAVAREAYIANNNAQAQAAPARLSA